MHNWEIKEMVPNLSRYQEKLLEETRGNIQRMGKWWELWLRPPKVEVGTTPKEIVYRENKSCLYRYHPLAKEVKPVPVLIVYALINRLYILDLYPGHSFVEHLLGDGLDLYAVDWGTAGDEDRSISLDYYIEGYLDRMVKKVMELSGAPQISLFGYCIGGTLAAIYSALHPERVRNLVLLTSPIDFGQAGYFTRFVDKRYFPIDMVVDAFGNIPPWFMQAGFKLLNPIGDMVKGYNFLKHMQDDEFRQNFFAVETWVNDNVPFPGEAYRKFIRELYQENLLFKGRLKINGHTVDLKKITASHLTIAGREDTIVPPAAATCIQKLISSRDNEVRVLPGGHVGVVIGSRALRTAWPMISDWMLQRSDSPQVASREFRH